MNSSLDLLVNNFVLGGHNFFGLYGYNKEQKSLLIRKGIYPYKYMDDWSKFDNTELSKIENFHSKLNMSDVSEEDYKHAKLIWNMGEYHDLYLRTDTILLANVFNSQYKLSSMIHNLEPSHFYTTPGLAWQACLKKTGVSLKLLLDPDMVLMFEQGIRGKITQSIHRLSSANNPRMGEEYKPNEKTKYLQYLDANNLYGWVTSQPLPMGGFK